MSNVKIAPSILSADFAKMGEEVASLQRCGADLIHVDVMDGVFVPNITFGIKMVEDIRKHTALPLDVHLMIVEPWKYVGRFAKAGADYITVHAEACGEKTRETLELIRSFGVKSGVVINPDTPAERAERVIEFCDMLLVMGVYPGFGGQKYIEEVGVKIQRLAEAIKAQKNAVLLEVDGGVTEENAAKIHALGADVLVAGSAVFKAEDRARAIKNLKGI
ncbi:MAG: ribulose-phosphate 3-epimerase [Bacillota bacterium]|nr:MAG: ribulose-phosphate 3-epimerase [Bacillota bacterium]